MSAFFIFALCLTMAYAVYYTVVIFMDLRKEPGGQRHSSEETFELEDLQPEQSRLVEETDRGFRVAGGSGPVLVHELADVNPGKDPHTDEAPEAPVLDATGAPLTEAQKKILALEEDMDPIDPEITGALVSDQLRLAMTGQLPSSDVERTVVPSGGSSGSGTDVKEVDHDEGRHV